MCPVYIVLFAKTTVPVCVASQFPFRKILAPYAARFSSQLFRSMATFQIYGKPSCHSSTPVRRSPTCYRPRSGTLQRPPCPANCAASLASSLSSRAPAPTCGQAEKSISALPGWPGSWYLRRGQCRTAQPHLPASASGSRRAHSQRRRTERSSCMASAHLAGTARRVDRPRQSRRRLIEQPQIVIGVIGDDHPTAQVASGFSSSIREVGAFSTISL